ncbi:MAG: ABC transporter ATP-binding protein [Firmicutes bacterium]|nr:ABC transporter ATP-binding protein [Candidatus Fermentithermobacillaceae bacterium]
MRKHRMLTVAVVGIGMFLSVARLGYPWVQKIFIDSVIAQKRADLLLMAAGLFVGAAVLEIGSMLLSTYISALYSQRILLWIREKIYGDYRASSYTTQTRIEPGRVVSLMLSDASSVSETFNEVVPGLATTVGTLVVNTMVLIALNYRLFLIALFFLPIYLLGPSRFSPLLYGRGREIQASVENLNAVLQDDLAGTADIYATGTRSWSVERILRAAREIMSASKRQAIALQLLGSSVFGSLIISQVTLLLVGGYFVIKGTMQLGVLLAYVSYTSAFFNSCKEIFRVSASLAGPKAAWDRIAEFLKTLDPIPGTYEPAEFMVPSIQMEGVTFGYRSDSPVIQEASLSAERGSTLCVVGPSGSGKSTILQLIAGFLKPWRGTCRVCGQEVSAVHPDDLRHVVSYVGPNPRIFHASVKENILLGREVSLEALAAACEVSGISEFVGELPNGLDTVLGDKGHGLSLGQQQRVGLARALVGKPKILILDEALSGLDARLANDVLTRLKAFQRDGIMVLATHRSDTRAYADRTVALENGRIVPL